MPSERSRLMHTIDFNEAMWVCTYLMAPCQPSNEGTLCAWWMGDRENYNFVRMYGWGHWLQWNMAGEAISLQFFVCFPSCPEYRWQLQHSLTAHHIFCPPQEGKFERIIRNLTFVLDSINAVWAYYVWCTVLMCHP